PGVGRSRLERPRNRSAVPGFHDPGRMYGNRLRVVVDDRRAVENDVRLDDARVRRNGRAEAKEELAVPLSEREHRGEPAGGAAGALDERDVDGPHDEPPRAVD